MKFPIEQHKNFQGWIPESDLDGTDIQSDSQFAADCENVDFENGFITQALKPTIVSMPSEVNSFVTNGYSLIGSIFYRHSDTNRGLVWVYVLYKAGPPKDIQIVVSDNDGVHTPAINEILVDNAVIGTIAITINEAPNNVNFSLHKDELKINLNCNISYGADLSQEAIGNFSLQWVESRTYGKGLGGVFRRPEGWYCFPRWLGWSYPDNLLNQTADADTIATFNANVTDIDDSHGESFTTGDVQHTVTTYYSGGGAIRFKSVVTEQYWEISGLTTYRASRIDFRWYAPSWGSAGSALSGCSLEFLDVNNVQLHLETLSPAAAWTWVIRDLGPYGEVDKVRIICPDHTGVTPVTYPHIDEFRVKYVQETGLGIMAVYDGNQRSIIQYLDEDDDWQYFDEITFNTDAIDWRVKSYELYTKVDTTWVRIAEIPTTEFEWDDITDTVTIEFDGTYLTSEIDRSSTDTLAFLYGLGASIVVDNQKNIYSEIAYGNRSYFIKGDGKLYQSHISGGGLYQPDSYPFDDDLQFGYTEIQRDVQLGQIFLSGLNDIVMLTTNGDCFVTSFGISRASVYKKTKYINGSMGISSTNSLPRNLSGSTPAQVAVWSDLYGIYLYAGGIQIPKNVIKPYLSNYYQALAQSDKSSAVGVFVKAKNEYWLSIDNTTTLVYELDFNKFRKYNLGYSITQYIGSLEDETYVLCSDKKIRKITQETDSMLAGYIVTHYNLDMFFVQESNGRRRSVNAPEVQDKILQEIFVTNGQAIDVNFGGTVTVWVDDNLLYPTMAFNFKMSRDIWKAPLLVRYGKIKFRVDMPGNMKVKLQGIGYTFTSPDQAPGNNIFDEIDGYGYNVAGGPYGYNM